ncbi:MAG: aminotransferase class I/II-fold pyridoxal phosphate-dependent enzyme [Patescibacteria group bacterium]
MEKFTLKYFQKYLDYLRENDLYPKIHEVEGPSTSPVVQMGGKKYLTFCSNNYLGLAEHPEVKEQTKKAIEIYGTGSGSTRLLSGTLDIQTEFESALAKHFGYNDSVTFSSGYLANAGVIRMLVDPFPYFKLPTFSNVFASDAGFIISDELNHASIIDGVRLAKADRAVYRHGDMTDLEKLLSNNKQKRKLIITDGVFSMDGDIANLKEITKLAKAYGAILFVDDSHAVGVLGPKGEGVAHYLEVEKDVDIIMGSFTKAFGSIGGFIVANQTIVDYIRITARSYIFSDPIPPAIVYGLITTLRVITEGDRLRKKVSENADKLRDGLKKAGFTVLGDKTPIVPLFVGNEKKAIQFSDELHNRGILAPCVRRPAVLEGKERIRFSVMASHSFEQIDALLNVCVEIGKKMHMI